MNLRGRVMFVALLGAGWLWAPAAAAAAAEVTEEAVRAHEADRELRVIGLSRVRLSHPQRLSAGLGALWARVPREYDCTTTCDYRGVTLQIEPGLGGAQLSVGWALLVGEKKHNEHFLSDVLIGVGVRAALLRTWGEAMLDPPSQTFVGVESDFTIIRVNFSLGAFRRAGGPAEADSWLVAGGIGWGF